MKEGIAMRPDGTRVKNASAIVSALPYIMPRRYDAHDYITEYAEMEPMRRYIQSKRREGVRISYMALILAAYFKAYQQHPKINRFIMNSKIYQRNLFCVSFVIFKSPILYAVSLLRISSSEIVLWNTYSVNNSDTML